MKSIVSYCFDRFLKSVGELRCASRESKVHLRIKDSKKDQVTRERERRKEEWFWQLMTCPPPTPLNNVSHKHQNWNLSAAHVVVPVINGLIVVITTWETGQATFRIEWHVKQSLLFHGFCARHEQIWRLVSGWCVLSGAWWTGPQIVKLIEWLINCSRCHWLLVSKHFLLKVNACFKCLNGSALPSYSTQFITTHHLAFGFIS